MKTISAALGLHLQGELSFLARLVRLTRADGRVIALTDHDRDLQLDGVVYVADGAFSAGRLDQGGDEDRRDMEIAGLLDSSLIDEEDIAQGLYDFARLDVLACNWRDLTQGAVLLRRGWLGEVRLEGGRYVAQLLDFHDLLRRRVGETYTPECRFSLGDGRCGVDLSSMTVGGTVTGLEGERRFSDTTRSEASGLFNDGVLTWTSGANAGSRAEIYSWDLESLSFTLWLAPLAPMALGDTYTVAPGCDKRFATCRARFDNAARYGGFPYLPGIGKILDYPEARA